jgi:hypothetical protein
MIHLSLRGVNQLLFVGAVGLQACTPIIYKGAPSSTTGSTTNASVTDLGAIDLSQSFASGYYSSANSSSLPVSSVCSTASLLGSSGTATCMTGSLSTPASASDVLAGKNYFDGSGTVQTGTLATRTLSSASTTVTAGYYAATTLTAVEANLVSGNIKAGTSIFGVGGDSNVVDTSSGDAVLGEILSGKKAFVGGSLVTGSMANQATWDARTAFPGAGYFAGISNTLSNAQVCSAATGGINFLGSAGTAVCLGSSGGANATASHVLSGTYFWDSTGTSTQGTMTDQGNSWDITTAFPGAGYYSGVSSALTQADVCSGKNFLGSAGTASCGGGAYDSFMASVVYRDPATTQITLSSEKSAVSLPSGYREVPDVNKDDDGYYTSARGCRGTGGNFDTCTPVTYASHAGTDCGTSGSQATRIADCALSWDGTTNGTAGESLWQLVTSINGKEVWKDTRTGLVWSDYLGADNWCKAAGNVQADDPAGFCNNASYQDQTTPTSYCSEATGLSPAKEGEDWSSGTYADEKGGMGKTAATIVRWRLPTPADWLQAEIDGVRFVLQSMDNAWWSASVVSVNRGFAWFFYGSYGYMYYVDRTDNYGVRCVGR